MKGLSGNGGSPTPRARRGRALDVVAARIFKMPPGHHDYTLTQAVRVPMRDGVELLTDIYAPAAKSLGTLLIRTPYGRTGLIALLTARYYATHGYQVVNQSCRGTFGSGGTSSHSGMKLMMAPTPSAGCAGSPGSADDSRLHTITTG
jgi:predicted acyl esterase